MCRRCQLGSVLQTFPGAEPHFDEPFVIVDEQLTVRSISLQAELVLLAREPHSFGAPLDAFLTSDCAWDEEQLAARIALAVAGTPAPDALELRTAGEPEVRFRARVSSCGPPAAALLVLTPVASREAPAADDELVSLVDALDDARRALGRVAGEELEDALDSVAHVRVLLERIEQGLLGFARQPEPAAEVNAEVSYLFPRDPAAPPDALPRHARRRRARDRAPRRGD